MIPEYTFSLSLSLLHGWHVTLKIQFNLVLETGEIILGIILQGFISYEKK